MLAVRVGRPHCEFNIPLATSAEVFANEFPAEVLRLLCDFCHRDAPKPRVCFIDERCLVKLYRSRTRDQGEVFTA